jgi:hypothetical protein
MKRSALKLLTLLIVAAAGSAAPALGNDDGFAAQVAAVHASIFGGRRMALTCIAVGADKESIDGRLDLESRVLRISSVFGARSPLDASLVDQRCSKPSTPIASSVNYDITPSSSLWGQYLLQLPKAAVASGAATFTANLHICTYDGDFSSSFETVLNCRFIRLR